MFQKPTNYIIRPYSFQYAGAYQERLDLYDTESDLRMDIRPFAVSGEMRSDVPETRHAKTNLSAIISRFDFF